MYRPIALLFALLLTCVSVSSAGLAASLGELRFRLSVSRASPDRLQLSIRDERNGGGLHSNGYAAVELAGLDRAALDAKRATDLRFALVREAGRLDCAGAGSHGTASGQCRFTADPRFADFLAAQGIARPDERQAFSLTMVGANRALVQALAGARYPVPTLDQLTGLAALQVSPAYIHDLSRRGFRPERLNDLLSFKALDVSPAYVEAMSRAGFRGLTADHIVQFKALGISPDYVAGLAAVGYGQLSPGEIVQLKALDVTPEYIRGFQRIGMDRLPVSKLIESKALGVTPQFIQGLRKQGALSLSADELVRLKIVGLLP